MLRLFVYGTLKRGFHNHAHYCRGVIAVENAWTLGRLYSLPQGYPMLVAPQSHQLTMGTTDYVADAATQVRTAAQWDSAAPQFADDVRGGEWEQVTGEVLTFDDPLTRLPALDSLEAFRPGIDTSMYHRVLVPIYTARIEPAWTYVAPGGRLPEGARRIGPSWV